MVVAADDQRTRRDGSAVLAANSPIGVADERALPDDEATMSINALEIPFRTLGRYSPLDDLNGMNDRPNLVPADLLLAPAPMLRGDRAPARGIGDIGPPSARVGEKSVVILVDSPNLDGERVLGA